MRRLAFAMTAVLLLALVPALPAAAQHPPGHTVTYVAQPGDTLSSIARQHCTTWQEIYHLNKAIIGPFPNVLRPGTALQVPNRCGPQQPTQEPPGGDPCDRGPSTHAQGPIKGNVYVVVLGDTLFSIANRFCTTVPALAGVNGIPNPWRIYAGQRLVIPGAGPPPHPSPPPRPTPAPTATPRPGGYVTISSPTPGSRLQGTFTASGTGAGLFEGNVLVRALANNGQVLAQQTTTLVGSEVGSGGPGTWSVQLTVNAPADTPGRVEASSPGSPGVTPVSVSVTFGPATSAFRYYAPGECQIQSRPSAPYFLVPNGPQTGQFGASASYSAAVGYKAAGQLWFAVDLEPGTGNLAVWVPASSTVSLSSGCYF